MPPEAREFLREARDLSKVKRRSLSRWMHQNHDDIAQEFERSFEGRPDWDAIVTTLAKHGFTARDGMLIKPATAKETWRRIHADIVRRRALQPAEPSNPVPVPQTRKPTVIRPPLPEPDLEDEPPVFRPMSYRQPPPKEN